MAKINTTFSFQDQITSGLTSLIETIANVTSTIQTMDSEMKSANAAISSVTEASKAMQNGLVNGVNPAVDETVEKASKAENGISKLASKLFTFNQLTQTVNTIKGIGNSFIGVMNDMAAAYDIQAQAELKTETVMRNHMHATAEQIQQIKDLASQQQSVGIYGDEMQLEGIQELATYIDDVETLKELVPIMNSFVAQKFGSGATVNSMVQSATALGKVMQGQTGGLSKQGYKFSEEEEKILQTGTEAQRVKVLYDSIIGNFGNMNEALAGNVQGQIMQINNDLGDLKEVTGGLLKPLQQEISATKLLMTRDFYAAMNSIIEVVAPIMQRAVQSFREFYTNVSTIKDNIISGASWIQQHIDGVAKGVVISLGMVSMALLALGVYYAYTKRQAIAAGVASVASAIKSAIAWGLAHLPLLMIIAAVVGVIAWLMKLAGVANVIGAVVGGVFGFIKTAIVDAFVLAWNTIVPVVNFFISIGETVYNAFANPLGALKNLWWSFADTLLSFIGTFATAIDIVTGSHLATGIKNARAAIQKNKLDDITDGGKKPWKEIPRLQQMQATGLVQGTIQGAKTGMEVANKIEGVIKGFDLPSTDGMTDAFKDALDDKFSTDGSGALKTSDQGVIEISNDYKELLTSAATRRFNATFKSVAPTVNVGGVVFNDTGSFDTFVNQLSDGIQEVSGNSLRAG